VQKSTLQQCKHGSAENVGGCHMNNSVNSYFDYLGQLQSKIELDFLNLTC